MNILDQIVLEKKNHLARIKKIRNRLLKLVSEKGNEES